MKKNLFQSMSLMAPVLLLSACSGTKEKATEPKPLNIIHIMTDDHSFQTISAYGHALGKLAPTPNIDRLAARGVLFRQAFVENSLSTPSRACLMTGLYSHQNGQRQLGKGIDTTKVFFSEILQQHGYQPIMRWNSWRSEIRTNHSACWCIKRLHTVTGCRKKNIFTCMKM